MCDGSGFDESKDTCLIKLNNKKNSISVRALVQLVPWLQDVGKSGVTLAFFTHGTSLLHGTKPPPSYKIGAIAKFSWLRLVMMARGSLALDMAGNDDTREFGTRHGMVCGAMGSAGGTAWSHGTAVSNALREKKSVKEIVSIKTQVNNIEKRLENDVVFVNLLRKDAKERLRVNETLMSLLFKLDSVRGVENRVREFRKYLAKKAVALQEKLDDVISDEKTEICDVSNSVLNKVHEGDDVSRNDQNFGITKGVVIREWWRNWCDIAKMMKLMIQISERNEMQTRMINSLSKRVEHLEKAFMNDKSRRRKKSYTREGKRMLNFV
uniref:BAG family molecular chaperone regulator 6-like n=1 Tax=Tanacetum cinerariifolium TaxID=118510 RepID=A0A699JE59_TANCI|nr:BAG family molecular chaperone regulator 6-like [Tanacetum cinerariifolium]